jgi:hypothetical protein
LLYPPSGCKFGWGRAGLPTFLLGATEMRQIFIVTAAVAVIVALFGATTMIAKVPHGTEIVSASGSIDTGQLMKDAKPLPVEQFDAI